MIGMLLAGAFLGLMAETFLNNVLPTIKTEFHFPQAAAQMAEHLFSTGGGGGLIILVSAWVFFNFSSRQTFMAMMAIFLTSYLVCVFSEGHFPLLLAGRII